MWAKDSLSPVFPGNYNFLLKLHSWSGVASDTNVGVHRNLCNCLGDLKRGMCPNPKKRAAVTSGKAQVPSEQEWDTWDALLLGPNCNSSDLPPDVLLDAVNNFEYLLLF